MIERITPQKLAFKITRVLNEVLGENHFPINVTEVAREYSHSVFPGDPITLIRGDSLPGFEAGLFKAPRGKLGWGIVYNKDIISPGRINYTLAHEFGHYLQHRTQYPDGIQCGERDMYRWDSEYRQIEYQANQFAANLLMPLDDYRRQIDPKQKVSIDEVIFSAERYGVSLLAVILRWIEFTEQRAVLVVSRSGYILWAKSSRRAFQSGAYIKTIGIPPVPVPAISFAANASIIPDEIARIGRIYDAGVWFGDPCEEFAIISGQYDFVISVIQLARTSECTYEKIRIL